MYSIVNDDYLSWFSACRYVVIGVQPVVDVWRVSSWSSRLPVVVRTHHIDIRNARRIGRHSCVISITVIQVDVTVQRLLVGYWHWRQLASTINRNITFIESLYSQFSTTDSTIGDDIDPDTSC